MMTSVIRKYAKPFFTAAVLLTVLSSCESRTVEIAKCTSATCASLEKACGSWPDGCGGTVACPSCGKDSTCTAEGRCECVPETCAELKKDCGRWKTRCGTEVECPGCGASGICQESAGTCGSEAVVMVPMADGVKLRTKVWLPVGTAKGATLLDRTPYRSPGGMQDFYDDQAAFYVKRGYAFVLQDVRGTHGSEGELYLLRDEVADGKTTVEWIRGQPWSGSRLGTIGSSYEGYTALAAAVDTQVDLVLADDPCSGIYYWNRYGIQSMGAVSYYWGDVSDEEEEKRIAKATRALDLANLDKVMTGSTIPVWQDMLRHPTPTDPFWGPMTLDPLFGRICAPAFVANSTAIGWSDPVRTAHGMWTQGCAEHREDIRLVVGNFAHGETIVYVPYGRTTQVSGLFLDFLDKYLGGEEIDLSGVPAVQYFAKKDKTGRGAAEWPPTEQDREVLYLHSSEGVDYLDGVPPDDEQPTEFVVNPAVADPCDPYDPETLSILYIGVVDKGYVVAGSPELELHVSGTKFDADFIVNILDYDPSNGDVDVLTWAAARGRWRGGFDSESPMVPGETFEFEIDFPPVSWEFLPGHQIVLYVTGATCSLIENPHTAEPLYAQTRWEKSVHSVFHDSLHPSNLSLPVVERAEPGASVASRRRIRPVDLTAVRAAVSDSRQDERRQRLKVVREAMAR